MKVTITFNNKDIKIYKGITTIRENKHGILALYKSISQVASYTPEGIKSIDVTTFE